MEGDKTAHLPFDWKTELLRMAIGQGPAFVVMAVVLWYLSEAVKDFVKVEIPRHITTINRGYEKINQDNIEANRKQTEKYTESIKYLTDAFNHNLDRIEKRLNDGR